MRVFVFILIICTGCCLSAETVALSRQVSISAKTQHTELTELAGMMLDTGQRISDTQRGKIILHRARSLQEATSGLADILGAPKEIE